MSLVKWFRKNNSKLMAVVVIVLMVGFIGGSSLTYLLRGRGDINGTIAYYGDNLKIKQVNLMNAKKELDILETLQAGTILKALQDPIQQTPNLHALLLGELLFSGQRPSQQIVAYLQQALGQYQYRISKKQINDLYKLTAQNYIYWFLLDQEAQNAGFKMPNDTIRAMLTEALPQLTGEYYPQFINKMMSRNGVSENEILGVFGKLLAVLQYSQAACSGQDLTIKQLKSFASTQLESINTEFVRVNAEKFISKIENPNEQQISDQFDMYKKYFPSEITEDNPYGFGYKLPERVQLEYMAVKLDDIEEIIKEPTFDEQGQFYNNNKANMFSEQVPNPADPNAGKIARIKPFSEVADQILDYLTQEKVKQKAEVILQEARSLADGKLEDYNDIEIDQLGLEKRKELAGDYKDIAEKLSKQYKVKIYQGITGELSAEDMQSDELLSRLYMDGYINQLNLARVVFGIEEFDMNILGIYETIKPKLYLSLVPVKDKTSSKQIMAVVRIVKAIDSSVPENYDLTYSKTPFILDPDQKDEKENAFSIKENIIKDIKRLTAMETAKTKANEFLELVSTQDDQMWENIIDKFNEIYEQEYASDSNNPDELLAEDSNEPAYELEDHYTLNKLSKDMFLTILQNQDNPASEGIKNLLNKETQFLDILFSIAPNDIDAPEFKPEVIEFKPDLSYYIVKDISFFPVWKETYEARKPEFAYKKDLSQSQSLAIDQFNPANILKRMNFRYAEEKEGITSTEPNEPKE